MTTTPGPARRALASGLTPAQYAGEMVEAFETLAWLDRIQAHRVRGGGSGPSCDPSTAAGRLLASQYHSAAQLDDARTAEFVRDALGCHLGVVAAHRAILDGAP